MKKFYFTTAMLIIFLPFISCNENTRDVHKDYYELKGQVQALNLRIDSLISLVAIINERNNSIPIIKKSRIKPRKTKQTVYSADYYTSYNKEAISGTSALYNGQ